MPNPVVVPILWGHDFVVNPATTKLITRLINDLVTGPFMNGMAQYGVRRGRVDTPIVIDDADPPSTIVYTDKDNNLVDEITHKLISWVEAKLVPAPPSDPLNQMYLIIPPSETTPEMYNGPGDPIGNGAQAWHNEGFTKPGPPPTYYWAIVKTNDCGSPSAGPEFVNNFAQKIAHELAEQFVDRNNTFKEIGDPCLNFPDTYRGWPIQKYWSDWDNGCISGDQPPPMPRSFQTADGYENIFVLGTDGKLWLEQSPFGTIPPTRTLVDETVFTFTALSNQTVVVLGTDGSLWIAYAPFGKVPPSRVRVDGNVQAFQVVDPRNLVVLDIDGNLWQETGPFGDVPPSRLRVDGDVKQFHQVAHTGYIFVLGQDGNLWLEQSPFGKVPPARRKVDTNVRSFQALDEDGFLWVLGNDGNLWLERSPSENLPPNRVLIDSTVLAYQPLDINHVFVLRNDGTLWLEQGSSGTPSRTQIDANVMEFAATDSQNLLVLGNDGKLWWEQAPFGVVPPKRTVVDATVA
jgi:hypothetical protein